MRKVVLYIAMSIDGYIAGEGDDLSWLDGAQGSEDIGEDYEAFYEGVTTILMGNGTYRYVVAAGAPDPYPSKESFVFTRTPNKESSYITYVSESPVAFTETLKAQDGGPIWLVGGGKINGLLLEADLIDELQITLAPITLGAGQPLFEGKSPWQNFDLVETKNFDHSFIKLTYRRKDRQ